MAYLDLKNWCYVEKSCSFEARLNPKAYPCIQYYLPADEATYDIERDRRNRACCVEQGKEKMEKS